MLSLQSQPLYLKYFLSYQTIRSLWWHWNKNCSLKPMNWKPLTSWGIFKVNHKETIPTSKFWWMNSKLVVSRWRSVVNYPRPRTHIVTAHTFTIHINSADITPERNMNYIMTFLIQNQRSKSIHAHRRHKSMHRENLAR